ncbi:hypothetical protein Pcinc_017266 [Petrolisthes cinctipes]|uniref:F-box domain-containing protein n=1 Tax=Petrolisthes cinctipes TaxID=88211 RepID=A0AAE1FPF1_PETCI|nr:hypothetical protein Pcinc_017266 [Petrolisthes cinctipes]
MMEGEVASEQAEDKHKVSNIARKLNSCTNDSGYSSDVFTSPELSRECLKGTFSKLPCLTPDVAKQPVAVTRLTSTPNCLDNQEIFCPPIPKLEVFDVSHTTSDAASSFSTSTALEMCELEVACLGTSNLQTNIPSTSKKIEPFREQSKHLARNLPERQKATLSKVITRRRASQWVFVRLLGEADYLAVRVLKYLSGKDLLTISHVNRQLRNLILQDKILSSRKTSYIIKRKKECENVGKENYQQKKSDGENESSESFGKLSPRKHLSAIQNLNPTSPKKSAGTPPIPSLSEKFIEEGRKLPKGQQLQKCAKCLAPAKVQKGQQRAICSCGYDYCTRCFLPYHTRPQECPSLKPRTRTGNGIFSDKCKRSLRRL